MDNYHRGEIAVQDRAGLTRQAGSAGRALKNSVPEVAAAFLAGQPMLVLGGTDGAGRVWATQLTGEPGFLTTPDPRTLRVGALPLPEDPLAGVLLGTGVGQAPAPARVGAIAIEPATRRRMRINGRSVQDGAGLRIDLDQVVSNCPKYLQTRDYRLLPADDPGTERTADDRRSVTDSTSLSPAQQEVLRSADTFFIATASDRGDADASHRGGNPGFVEVLSPTRLRWPDYLGNSMFLTLGNLEVNPAAGILLPGWETGSTLHLTGAARTVWDAAEIARVPGAQRLVEFEIAAVREVMAASRLRWSQPGYSRFNPPVAGRPSDRP
ncbi:pyridoxamine 5'-phosphate oxidase family protein [Streptomyces sp. NPDC060022]|uniref:pyridoxamine 5'-phosphate oxidase family protein n=1 Tax=Streptomyces sp. NPDC060022 TaxID=3347039 RepID=UPI00367CAF2C